MMNSQSLTRLILTQAGPRWPGTYGLDFSLAMMPSRPRSQVAWKKALPSASMDYVAWTRSLDVRTWWSMFLRSARGNSMMRWPWK